MLTLLKRDFILAKKQIFTVILYSLACAPVLFTVTEPSRLKCVFLLGVCSFIAIYMVSNSISITESANSRAQSYLCALPYDRPSFVLERYLLDFLMLLTAGLGYALASLLFDTVVRLALIYYLSVIAIMLAYRGVLIPLEIIFGYEKTKYISLVMLMAFAFGIPLYIDQFGIPELNVQWFTELSKLQQNGLILGVILAIEGVSVAVSIRSFNRKEL